MKREALSPEDRLARGNVAIAIAMSLVAITLLLIGIGGLIGEVHVGGPDGRPINFASSLIATVIGLFAATVASVMVVQCHRHGHFSHLHKRFF